jgi:hypothetical protein
MSVISNLVAQPNRIIIAFEFVQSFGDKGATLNDLDKMLTPVQRQQNQFNDSALERDTDDPGGTTIAAGVLSEMLKLHILERTEDDIIRLAPIFSGSMKKVEWTERLYKYLFPILTSTDSAREHGQAELPDAFCWLLQQSPTQNLGKSTGHYNVLTSQVINDDPLCRSIGNDARYQNLVYWARYLGLAERLSIKPAADTVIADPTRAIAHRLPLLFGDERQITLDSFLQRLGTHIPLLNGGRVWQEMQVRFKETFKAKDKHLGQPLSLAMLRLQQAGKIKVEGLSDAAAWVLEVARESRSVSHVTYLENRK